MIEYCLICLDFMRCKCRIADYNALGWIGTPEVAR